MVNTKHKSISHFVAPRGSRPSRYWESRAEDAERAGNHAWAAEYRARGWAAWAAWHRRNAEITRRTGGELGRARECDALAAAAESCAERERDAARELTSPKPKSDY